MGIMRGTTSTWLQGVLWASQLDQAQWAAELWYQRLAQGHRQGKEMCCVSQARAAQESAHSRPAGVNGIFQNKRRGLRAGGEPLREAP